MNLPEKIYTERDIARVKSSAKMIGWAQGAAVVLGGAIVLNLLGWVPVVLGVGAAGYVLYKVIGPNGKDPE